MAESLDKLDRALLDIIQSSFPIDSDPYRILGEQVGISREEAYERVCAMRKSGLVRRLGANFQSSGLGFVSTLCAAHVPEAGKAGFIEAVNSIRGVTHNYERNHHFNIWFTLISENRESAQAILSSLSERTGIEIMNLPATRMYKIRVDFPME